MKYVLKITDGEYVLDYSGHGILIGGLSDALLFGTKDIAIRFGNDIRMNPRFPEFWPDILSLEQAKALELLRI